MESLGIVSEKNGAKPRNVLIDNDEWQQKLHSLSINYETVVTTRKDSHVESVAAPEPKVNSFDFPGFLMAVNIAINQGAVSTALLQRKLSIGFGKAAKFIDKMEEMGIVSEKNGANPRNALIDKETWSVTLNKLI
jgi:DNA segregation ATPase FtsK/SpoIIIE-like protein